MKFFENFEILCKFWNAMKILNFFEILDILKFFEIFLILKFLRNFRVFVNRRWSPSVPNKYKLLSNPVVELKIRENDSHCRSIVLNTMDRSIVKQL